MYQWIGLATFVKFERLDWASNSFHYLFLSLFIYATSTGLQYRRYLLLQEPSIRLFHRMYISGIERYDPVLSVGERKGIVNNVWLQKSHCLHGTF